jgi:hypothetical protein
MEGVPVRSVPSYQPTDTSIPSQPRVPPWSLVYPPSLSNDGFRRPRRGATRRESIFSGGTIPRQRSGRAGSGITLARPCRASRTKSCAHNFRREESLETIQNLVRRKAQWVDFASEAVDLRWQNLLEEKWPAHDSWQP